MSTAIVIVACVLVLVWIVAVLRRIAASRLGR